MSPKNAGDFQRIRIAKFSKHLADAVIDAGGALFDENGDVQGFPRIQ